MLVTRLPAQLRVRLGGVDRVTPVMPEPVGDVFDQDVRFAEGIEDHFDHVDIPHLAIAADIVNFPGWPFMQRGDNRRAMILHMDPVAHIQAVAIDRQRLVCSALTIISGISFSGN